MNNEQDLILRQKIEKREKIDTIIAYVLIVILLGCMALVLALKFAGKDEEKTEPDEYTPTYISLNEINNSFNKSELVKGYTDNGINFKSSVSGNALIIDYVEGEEKINLNVPIVGNEIKFTLDDKNSKIITDIYKEIASIICVYYGNEEKFCKITLNNIDSNGNDSRNSFISFCRRRRNN